MLTASTPPQFGSEGACASACRSHFGVEARARVHARYSRPGPMLPGPPNGNNHISNNVSTATSTSPFWLKRAGDQPPAEMPTSTDDMLLYRCCALFAKFRTPDRALAAQGGLAMKYVRSSADTNLCMIASLMSSIMEYHPEVTVPHSAIFQSSEFPRHKGRGQAHCEPPPHAIRF